MKNHNGKKFSTFDKDNEEYNENYAVISHGAWWFYDYCCCHYAHLNGRYYKDSTVICPQGVTWYDWHGFQYSLKATQMMIRKI